MVVSWNRGKIRSDPDFIVSQSVFFSTVALTLSTFALREIISSSFLAVVIPLTYMHFFYF